MKLLKTLAILHFALSMSAFAQNPANTTNQHEIRKDVEYSHKNMNFLFQAMENLIDKAIFDQMPAASVTFTKKYSFFLRTSYVKQTEESYCQATISAPGEGGRSFYQCTSDLKVRGAYNSLWIMDAGARTLIEQAADNRQEIFREFIYSSFTGEEVNTLLEKFEMFIAVDKYGIRIYAKEKEGTSSLVELKVMECDQKPRYFISATPEFQDAPAPKTYDFGCKIESENDLALKMNNFRQDIVRTLATN